MPPDLWWQGLSSKEGLHEHAGHDPVIVAKVPKLMRYQPPPTVQYPVGARWLRSTWFLCGGSWEKVEDRVEPALQWERIDKYVERAVWQFHPAQPAAPAPTVIQPRQHFGRDDSFNFSFRKSMARTSWIRLSIPSLQFFLRCFKAMMRRMHAHHREQDNHRFFVPYRIAVRNHLQPADPDANITFRFVNHNGTGTWLAWLCLCTWFRYWHRGHPRGAPTNPRLSWRVPSRTTGLPRLRNAGAYRLLRSHLRMTCYPSTGRTLPSTPSPKRVTCYFLLDPAREGHRGRD